ncbi:hypothetical protein EMIT0P44_40029 [Pseudomonas sp. IT-P44]
MQIFRIMCKELFLEIFLIQTVIVSQIKRSPPRFTRQLLQAHEVQCRSCRVKRGGDLF